MAILIIERGLWRLLGPVLITGALAASAMAQEAVDVTCGPQGRLAAIQSGGETTEIAQPVGTGGRAAREAAPLSESGLCDALTQCWGSVSTLVKTGSAVYGILVAAGVNSDPKVPKYEKASPEERLSDLRYRLLLCEEARINSQRAQMAPIEIIYSAKGPNRKKSGRYDSGRLAEIVEHALGEGVDPFLALAIVLMENPPLANGSENSAYEQGYGLIPIDQVAGMDMMGCGFRPRPRSIPREWQNGPVARRFLRLAAQQNQARAQVENLLLTIPMKKQLEYQTAKMALDAEKGSTENGRDGDSDESQPPAATSSLADAQARLRDLLRDPALRRLHDAIGPYEAAVTESSQLHWKLREEVGEFQAKEMRCYADRVRCYGTGAAQASVPRLNLTYLSRHMPALRAVERYCHSAENIQAGAHLELTAGEAGGGCCVDADYGGPEAVNMIRSRLGVRYLKEKVQNCARDNSMSACIQRFNGLGCFNCTEVHANNCLQGIVMRDRPVYGARTADLMLNSLMTNPKIVKLVRESAARMGTGANSLFCQGRPAGRQSLRRDSFLEEQRRYLLNEEGRPYAARLQTNGRVELRLPAGDAELAAFRQRDGARAKACLDSFK